MPNRDRNGARKRKPGSSRKKGASAGRGGDQRSTPAASAHGSRVSREALPPTSQLTTLAEWVAFAEEVYERMDLALGQISPHAHDEALYLFLRKLDWPLDGDASLLEKRLQPQERITLRTVLEQRAVQRIPAAYLTREAWLNDQRFYVDERVLIPRSYFLEVIPNQLPRWFPKPRLVRHVTDVCTGSGCLAILLAHHFSRAQVDAVDLSADALAVAKINVGDHGLASRVHLHRSDVFDSVPKPSGGYDLIISNPPYEPSALCDALPEEFKKEPRLALDGGADGLKIIRKLILQARERLAPEGLLLIEVGELQLSMEREFASLGLEWLPSEDGSNCVCAIRASALQATTRVKPTRTQPFRKG